MNAAEYLDHLAERRAAAVPGSLRAVMYGSEGIEATDTAGRRGLRAWAVERRSPVLSRRSTAIVFGSCASDAMRRASAPARLGPEIEGDDTIAALILSGWDEPVRWPLPRREDER